VLIDPTTSSTDQNVGRAPARTRARYRFDLGAWHAAASATWTDPRNLSTATRCRGATDANTLEVRYQGSAIELLAALRASGPRSDVDDFGLPARTAGYALLALGARWRVTPAWSVQVKVDNALDRDYALAYGYRTAGRSFSVATRYQLR
jgi:vitamin B12 transporter